MRRRCLEPPAQTLALHSFLSIPGIKMAFEAPKHQSVHQFIHHQQQHEQQHETDAHLYFL